MFEELPDSLQSDDKTPESIETDLACLNSINVDTVPDETQLALLKRMSEPDYTSLVKILFNENEDEPSGAEEYKHEPVGDGVPRERILTECKQVSKLTVWIYYARKFEHTTFLMNLKRDVLELQEEILDLSFFSSMYDAIENDDLPFLEVIFKIYKSIFDHKYHETKRKELSSRFPGFNTDFFFLFVRAFEIADESCLPTLIENLLQRKIPVDIKYNDLREEMAILEWIAKKCDMDTFIRVCMHGQFVRHEEAEWIFILAVIEKHIPEKNKSAYREALTSARHWSKRVAVLHLMFVLNESKKKQQQLTKTDGTCDSAESALGSVLEKRQIGRSRPGFPKDFVMPRGRDVIHLLGDNTRYDLPEAFYTKSHFMTNTTNVSMNNFIKLYIAVYSHSRLNKNTENLFYHTFKTVPKFFCNVFLFEIQKSYENFSLLYRPSIREVFSFDSRVLLFLSRRGKLDNFNSRKIDWRGLEFMFGPESEIISDIDESSYSHLLKFLPDKTSCSYYSNRERTIEDFKRYYAASNFIDIIALILSEENDVESFLKYFKVFNQGLEIYRMLENFFLAVERLCGEDAYLSRLEALKPSVLPVRNSMAMFAIPAPSEEGVGTGAAGGPRPGTRR